MKSGDAPLVFDGATAPGCRLLNGPTQDLNLMIRHGSGVMQSVQSQTAWHGPFSARGLYTLDAGEWQAGGQSRTLPAHTLLWAEDASAVGWTFQPASTNTRYAPGGLATHPTKTLRIERATHMTDLTLWHHARLARCQVKPIGA